MSNEIPFSVCPWSGDARWVYSITFDEALSELHQFAIPILAEYGVPGHMEVVVGQLGEVRQLMQSSYNGMRHMNALELRAMIEQGWGVGSHSWSHTYINLANMDRELGDSKKVLEGAIGQPVTVYCAPGGNFNMEAEILDGCREYGYIGAMGIYDRLNRPDDEDLMWISRTYLHDNGPNMHDSEFDPYKRIMHAQKDQGWIIDYLHCPLEEAVHPRKDCSAEQLRRRIAAIVSEGGNQVWLAKVEDPMDYRHTRQCLKVEPLPGNQYKLTTPDIPAPVSRRTLTLSLPDGVRAVEVNGVQAHVYGKGQKALVDVDVSNEPTLTLYAEGKA